MTAQAELRHTTLLGLMTPEFMEALVVHVLRQKGELPNEARQKLHAAINAVAKVPRFHKKPAIAPATFLKGPILDQLLSSETLANAVLQAWFVSQETLYGIVKGHLHSRGMDVEYPDFVGHEFREAWPYDDWMSERENLLATHRDLDEDHVALMLCFATDKVPDGPQVTLSLGSGSDSMDRDILNQARRYLELLPADSPDWSTDVPDFLTEVTEIIGKKKMELESAAAVQVVNGRIAELIQYSSALEYLELELTSWEIPPSLSSAELAGVWNRLTEFSNLLQEYDPIPNMGSSLSESQRLRMEHDAASQHIQGLKLELDRVLSSRVAVDHKSGNEGLHLLLENGELESSQGGSLSAIKLSHGTVEFRPTRTNYEIELDNAVEGFTITPVAVRADASFEVTIETPEGKRIKALEPESGTFLVEEHNVDQAVILIDVASEDSIGCETYTLTVTRTQSRMTASSASADASLKGLHLSAASLEFAPGVLDFNVGLIEVPDGLIIFPDTTHDAASLIVTALLADGTTLEGVRSENAGFEIPRSALGKGDVTIRITVTAEDHETTQVYTVVVKGEAIHDLPASLWFLVEQDDLAGAYWHARSMAAQGLNPPVPPSLLMAVQGGRWLSPDSDAYVEDLFDIVGEFEDLVDDEAQVLLRLAAGIMPTLISPETNLLAWLSSPRRLPGLEMILSPIREFASSGYPLRPEHISGDEGNQYLQGLIIQASAEARKWLEEAPHYHTRFPWAVRVWQQLCKEGVLNQMLTPVSEDRRGEANSVQRYIKLLSQDGNDEVIHQAEDSIGGRPPKQSRIVGNARDWLIKRIEEARERATKWCYLVSRENETQSGMTDHWLQEQVSNLRGRLRDECPLVFEELRELASAGAPPDIVAAAKCVTRSLQQLADYLNLEIRYETVQEPPAIVHDLKTINRVAKSVWDRDIEVGQLEAAISRRLLWEPSAVLDDTGLPRSDASLVDVARATANNEIVDKPLEIAIRRRMDQRDFRFFDLLISGMPATDVDRLERTFLTELAVERKTLQQAIGSTQATVDQAEKDGVIEFEGSQWNKHNHALDDMNVEEALNFRPFYDTLEEIKNELHKEREQRRQELSEEWKSLVEESAEDADLDRDFLKEVVSTFERARSDDSLDIRVMEDCVSRLRNRQSGEEGSVAQATRGDRQPRLLEEFLDFYREIRNPKAYTRDGNGLHNLAQELKAEV